MLLGKRSSLRGPWRRANDGGGIPWAASCSTPVRSLPVAGVEEGEDRSCGLVGLEGNVIADFERREALHRALARLSEEEQEAIALRFGADLSVPEMARVLKEPLTTVEGRVYRALRKLRERLEPLE